MKFVLWIREDRNKDNPVNVEFFDGDIFVDDKWFSVVENGRPSNVPIKDVCMIDFNIEEYKFLEKG